MPFSFNPGQITSGGSPGVPGVTLPGSAPAQAGIPTVPDSPFLFLQQRGQEKTVGAYLQALLALVAACSVVAAITVFAYGQYLTSSLEAKKIALTDKESSFKDYPIEEMKALSDKAAGVSQLLSGYVSIQSPLKFLEDVVENRIVFSEFVLSRVGTTGVSAQLTVATNDYEALIQQLEAMKLTQYKKIAPSQKIDKFEEKPKTIKVIVDIPILAQGILPDEVVFIKPSDVVASTTAPAVPTVGTNPTSP